MGWDSQEGHWGKSVSYTHFNHYFHSAVGRLTPRVSQGQLNKPCLCSKLFKCMWCWQDEWQTPPLNYHPSPLTNK